MQDLPIKWENWYTLTSFFRLIKVLHVIGMFSSEFLNEAKDFLYKNKSESLRIPGISFLIVSD